MRMKTFLLLLLLFSITFANNRNRRKGGDNNKRSQSQPKQPAEPKVNSFLTILQTLTKMYEQDPDLKVLKIDLGPTQLEITIKRG